MLYGYFTVGITITFNQTALKYFRIASHFILVTITTKSEMGNKDLMEDVGHLRFSRDFIVSHADDNIYTAEKYMDTREKQGHFLKANGCT